MHSCILHCSSESCMGGTHGVPCQTLPWISPLCTVVFHSFEEFLWNKLSAWHCGWDLNNRAFSHACILWLEDGQPLKANLTINTVIIAPLKCNAFIAFENLCCTIRGIIWQPWLSKVRTMLSCALFGKENRKYSIPFFSEFIFHVMVISDLNNYICMNILMINRWLDKNIRHLQIVFKFIIEK